jgi:hypothetical protein
LHGWITQQIDEREAAARAATPGPWHVTEYDWQTDFDAGVGTTPGEVDVVGHGHEGGGVERTEDARHIVANDPATVLRRCAADRKALALHQPEPGQHPDFCGYDKHELPCPGLRLLAEAYGRKERADA